MRRSHSLGIFVLCLHLVVAAKPLSDDDDFSESNLLQVTVTTGSSQQSSRPSETIQPRGKAKTPSLWVEMTCVVVVCLVFCGYQGRGGKPVEPLQKMKGIDLSPDVAEPLCNADDSRASCSSQCTVTTDSTEQSARTKFRSMWVGLACVLAVCVVCYGYQGRGVNPVEPLQGTRGVGLSSETSGPLTDDIKSTASNLPQVTVPIASTQQSSLPSDHATTHQSTQPRRKAKTRSMWVEATCVLAVCLVFYGYQGRGARPVEPSQKTGRVGLSPDAVLYDGVLNACAEKSEVDRVEHWFERMGDSSPPDKVTYSNVIHALAEKGDVGMAEHWLKSMREHNHSPDQGTYHHVMQAYAEQGNVEMTEQWFQHLCDANLQPNATTYNCVVRACAESGDADSAEQWLQRMCAATVTPDEETHNSIASAHARIGNIDKSAEWFQRMRDANLKPNTSAYTSIVRACAEKGQVQYAEKWLQQMRGSSLRPDEATYNMFVRACADKGEAEMVERLIEYMRADGSQPSQLTHDAIRNM